MSVETYSPKVSLVRVRINSGGYDDSGCYWGVGAPLYCAMSDDWDYAWYFRAYGRDDARETVLARYPAARFYR